MHLSYAAPVFDTNNGKVCVRVVCNDYLAVDTGEAATVLKDCLDNAEARAHVLHHCLGGKREVRLRICCQKFYYRVQELLQLRRRF